MSTSDDNIFEKEITVKLVKGEVISIWSEMDVEYNGETRFLFHLRSFKNGKEIGARFHKQVKEK